LGKPTGVGAIALGAVRAQRGGLIVGRLGFESFLLELSAFFAKAPPDSVERGINDWLRKLTQFIEVDRIGLWECDADGVHLHRRHFCSEPDLEPPTTINAAFPWLNEEYRRGRIVSCARLPDDLPAHATAERAYLIQAGAKSMLGIPLRVGSALYVLSFACARTYRTWPQSLVRRLQLVGEIFASAILRLSTERSLVASESKIRAILKALPDLIFVQSPDGVFIDCHCPEKVDLWVPPEEFLGRTMEEVLPPEMAIEFRSAFRQATETGEVVEVEYALPVGGEERHFESRTVRREDGAMVSVVRNITERHRAADQLRDSEQRFRLSFAHSAVGVALVSLDGHFLQVNAALCRILGYSETELESTTFQALTYPEDLAPDIAHLRRTIAGEISHYELEKRYLHKDGRIIWALLTVALVRNTSNEPLYFVSQVLDINQRRQAQMEIEQARLELAHIDRVSLVGQLTTSLAHELLQPITAVVTNAESGLHAPDLGASPEMRELLQDIIDSGRRAAEIIHNVRELLRKERGPPAKVDLNRVVEEVTRVMRSDLLLHQVRLITHLDSASTEIDGDRVELRQVLLNLMLNGTEAMSAIPADERELVVATIVRAGAVELSVRDSGTGSAPENLNRLIEPFFTTKPRGVGMGLSICAEIVRTHKGQLLAENNADRGMTWRCLLPRG
jgi:PAS domain S-box-containing protein